MMGLHDCELSRMERLSMNKKSGCIGGVQAWRGVMNQNGGKRERLESALLQNIKWGVPLRLFHV